MKITNPNYRNFLDKGDIKILTETDIKKALNNITPPNIPEARSLLLTLYYTGARPNEVLALKSHDFTKEGSYLKIQMPASKGGLTRPIYLQLKNPLINEIHQYTKKLPPTLYVFHHFKNNHTRIIDTKKGQHTYTSTTDKLRYHINKWFHNVIPGSIPPYYLRHNRFSKLIQNDASPEDIRVLKGAKKLDSVFPYLHLSTKTAKKTARKIN